MAEILLRRCDSTYRTYIYLKFSLITHFAEIQIINRIFSLNVRNFYPRDLYSMFIHSSTQIYLKRYYLTPKPRLLHLDSCCFLSSYFEQNLWQFNNMKKIWKFFPSGNEEIVINLFWFCIFSTHMFHL